MQRGEINALEPMMCSVCTGCDFDKKKSKIEEVVKGRPLHSVYQSIKLALRESQRKDLCLCPKKACLSSFTTNI